MPISGPPPPVPDSLAVLGVAEMYAADRAAAAAGTASLDLMEAAGAAVARVVITRWTPRPVAVLCGPGNNGGDGFVAARHLAAAGWPVRVALFVPETDLRGDAAVNAIRWRAAGKPLHDPNVVLDGRPLVIDALFGAGLSRPLAGEAARAVDRISDDHLICVAVDVPSGVAGDSGEALGEEARAPRCAATVTFFRLKPAHLLFPGRALCGDVTVADIGIPARVLDGIAPRTLRNAPAAWHLPVPGWADHKYTRGHAVVVGGGTVTGAARLAARGARRIGAGLLTLAVPAEAVGIYATGEPGAFVAAVHQPGDLDGILADARKNAVLIGPGAGVSAATAVHVLSILATDKAVVLDADALTVFAEDPAMLFGSIRRRHPATILTPHAGEFERLFGKGKGGKLARAREAATASGAIVVFKGPDTVVAHPDGRAALADNAPPWLATGGSGDVLAGMALGLLAQRCDGWTAATAAVWLHGAAGAACGRGLIAEDLPERLPAVLASLETLQKAQVQG